MAKQKKNLFEIRSDLGEGWQSDNKVTSQEENNDEIKPPEKHQLHMAKEKRRGKTVTVIKPFHLAKEDLKALLKTLKKKLGTGGTIKENTLEFQGDVPDTLRASLEEMHYRFKI